jgi:hypothetical protein
MSFRSHFTLTDGQHAFLVEESLRTGLSMAELVRRAIDATYRRERRPTVAGFHASLNVARRPDAAVIGRLATSPRQVRD